MRGLLSPVAGGSIAGHLFEASVASSVNGTNISSQRLLSGLKEIRFMPGVYCGQPLKVLTSLGLIELLERGGASQPCLVSELMCGGSTWECCLCLPQKEALLGAAQAVGKGRRGPRQGTKPPVSC